MARDIFLKIETYGKSGDDYKASPAMAYFLTRCGWTERKVTRSYRYLQPPQGHLTGKNAVVKVHIPTDDEILATANEMHAASVASIRMQHGWPIEYFPANHVPITTYDVDPFTGARGEPRTILRDESAVCRIGFISIWQAEVRWDENGSPIMKIYPKCEVQPPDQGFFNFQSISQPDTLPPLPDRMKYYEGSLECILIDRFERNPQARKACIQHYGALCQVCGLDFEKRYGDIGKGFIHVHQVKPLSEIREQYQVDPVNDLRPVCPNCHAMLHRLHPPMAINTLKSLLG